MRTQLKTRHNWIELISYPQNERRAITAARYANTFTRATSFIIWFTLSPFAIVARISFFRCLCVCRSSLFRFRFGSVSSAALTCRSRTETKTNMLLLPRCLNVCARSLFSCVQYISFSFRFSSFHHFHSVPQSPSSCACIRAVDVVAFHVSFRIV